jgi:ubiquinol-cytochrome c reductase cytochrome b subunit
MIKAIRDWIEIRVGLDELVRTQLTEYRVPRNINIFYSLGFVALAAFVLQVATGLMLLIYYVPHQDHAFESVQKIMTAVHYGWLFRSMHSVGSNLMVVVVMLHMLSVFFMGSYQKPRELTWVAGALMLFVTLTFCLSGYLLPWSQLSYWATTIVTAIPTAFPYVGEFMADCLRGDVQVSGATLGRFYALHVGVLPASLLLLLGLHLFLIRRIGISAPPFGAGDAKESWTSFRHEDHPDGYPFYPHYTAKELYMVMGYLAVMFFIIAFLPTLFLPPTALIPADPLKTPAHIKPEWYFLAPYQMLKAVPSKFLGVALQMIATLLFLAWPFVDTAEERNILRRRRLLAFFIVAVVAWLFFTVWGHYS